MGLQTLLTSFLTSFIEISPDNFNKTDVIHRVHTGPGNPGKSWNFILAFSRTGKPWKLSAGPRKSWKSINPVIEFSLKTVVYSIIF